MDQNLPTVLDVGTLVRACVLAAAIGRFLLDTCRPLLLPADLSALRGFFVLLDQWDRE